MDTKIWHKTTFSKESLPLWNCPHCHNGILKLADGKSHFEETESSKDGHKEDYWEPEFIRYVFSGFLECSTCHELVAFVGDDKLSMMVSMIMKMIFTWRIMEMFLHQFIFSLLFKYLRSLIIVLMT